MNTYEFVPLYKCKGVVFITWMTESIKTLIKCVYFFTALNFVQCSGKSILMP